VPLSVHIHRNSDPAGLLIWCVIGFCAGIALFLYGFRLLQRRRLILEIPFSKIRSASIGMIEVSGLATGPYTMIAPITARPCYYYRTLIWEWKQRGKSKHWVKIAGECMHVPFFVDDNTGRVLIDPRGADLDLHRDFEQEFCDSFFSTKELAPENVRTFLARHGVVTNNKIKVEEFCIKPKNALFILGTLAENRDVEVTRQPIGEDLQISSVSLGTFSLSIRPMSLSSTADRGELAVVTQPDLGSHEVVRLPSAAGPCNTSEMTQQQKIAAALVRAGISNPNAWSAAGLPSDSALPVQVFSEPAWLSNGQSSPSHFDLRPPVVLKKGENNQTFLISFRSRQELGRILGWKSTLMIWGGPILALLSLYALFGVVNLTR
jgi:E3 Ubiquitin ligase